jgi:large subunit ribosomal protein L25
MRTSFTIGADAREMQGKGASRRLRRAGKVPAILYGGQEKPHALVLDQQNLLTMIDSERFFSSVVQLKLEGKMYPAIVKDVQMHPARNVVVHVDLQRVVENEVIRIHVPIHFKGASICPGVKLQGGVVSHRLADVEISCLPKDLPEFLEIDMSAMNLNETRFLADIPLPIGVSIPDLAHGKNLPVVSVHSPRAAEPEPVAATAAASEGAATAAAPAAAGDAKKDDKKDAAPAKKEAGKK